MEKLKYVLASSFVIISAVLYTISYWSVVKEPHIEDWILPVIFFLSISGLGLIILKKYIWMKWVLSLILVFELANLIEVFRFQDEFIIILTIAQFILLLSAATLLFLPPIIKVEEHPA